MNLHISLTGYEIIAATLLFFALIIIPPYKFILQKLKYKKGVNSVLSVLSETDLILLRKLLPKYVFANSVPDAKIRSHLQSKILMTPISYFVRIEYNFSTQQYYIWCDSKFYKYLNRYVPAK